MKKLFILICFIISTASFAQRDINHWQLSLMGGGFYFSESVSNTLEDVDEPGYYSLGLRLQKRLGADFQVGLSFLENRFREDFDSGVRMTNLNLAYNWDNGYLLSQRAIVAPYHLAAVGLRTTSSDTDIDLENTTGIVSVENGLKIRLGDDWSTQVGFVYNWNSENEKFDNVFNSENSYGVRLGLSFHFGQVQTNYRGPVFNAGRSYGERDMSYYDFNQNFVYLALNGGIAREVSVDPSITIDVAMAKRGMEVMSSEGITSMIFPNDSLFQLIGDNNHLDSLYESRGDVVKISQTSLTSLKQASDHSSKSDMSFGERVKSASQDETDLVDRQNRLIENQNEFIRMLLNYSQTDSLNPERFRMETNSISAEKRSWKKQGADTVMSYTEEDSAALERVTSIDSAHVTQWDEEVMENDGSVNRRSDIKQYQDSLSKLRTENARLRNEPPIESEKKSQKSGENSHSKSNTGQEDSTQALAELRDRMSRLEEENKRLRETSQSESSEMTDADRALLEETKRRNDLLEDQIRATQQLAEKNAEPTEVVIDDNRRNDRSKVNLQPGVVVPVGGGGSGNDNEEVLENQEKMQARLDSLSQEIAKLKQEQPMDSTSAVSSGRNYSSSVYRTEMQDADSIAADTSLSNYPTDTLRNTDHTLETDSLLESQNYKVDKERSTEPEMQLDETDVAENYSGQADTSGTDKKQGDETKSRSNKADLKQNYPVQIFFALNSSGLSGEAKNRLKKVVEELGSSEEYTIVLEGHTDKSGNADYNEMLSRRRADAVRTYFEENGIASERIKIKPLGSKQADKQYNESSRRVDITLK